MASPHLNRKPSLPLRGVILAGGLGSRLFPLTKITNKHLLPVYDRPMVHYLIQMMLDAGIRRVVLVTGGQHAGEFVRLLGDGRGMGLESLQYVYQEGEGGIAAALGLVRDLTGESPIAVLLGDNLFEYSFAEHAKRFAADPKGAHLLLKEVPDPQRFGVARIRDGRVVEIIEKPKSRVSPWAVTGLYFYDHRVFDLIRRLKPSRRGELEITDVNNAYIREKEMRFSYCRGWWADCGTFDSLFRANQRMERICRLGTSWPKSPSNRSKKRDGE